MLSPKTLERVSASYRRGYYAGYEKRTSIDAKASDHPFDRPFANSDFANGYRAGLNDRAWADFYANRGPNPKEARKPDGELSK